MKIKLIGDKVLVKYLPIEEIQMGNIFINEKETREHKAAVLALGSSKLVDGVQEPFDVTEGDIVLITPKNPIFIDGSYMDDTDRSSKYRIISSNEIIAILGRIDDPVEVKIEVVSTQQSETTPVVSRKKKVK